MLMLVINLVLLSQVAVLGLKLKKYKDHSFHPEDIDNGININEGISTFLYLIFV